VNSPEGGTYSTRGKAARKGLRGTEQVVKRDAGARGIYGDQVVGWGRVYVRDRDYRWSCRD